MQLLKNKQYYVACVAFVGLFYLQQPHQPSTKLQGIMPYHCAKLNHKKLYRFLKIYNEWMRIDENIHETMLLIFNMPSCQPFKYVFISYNTVGCDVAHLKFIQKAVAISS
jgi:hypothetical protein